MRSEEGKESKRSMESTFLELYFPCGRRAREMHDFQWRPSGLGLYRDRAELRNTGHKLCKCKRIVHKSCMVELHAASLKCLLQPLSVPCDTRILPLCTRCTQSSMSGAIRSSRIESYCLSSLVPSTPPLWKTYAPFSYLPDQADLQM